MRGFGIYGGYHPVSGGRAGGPLLPAGSAGIRFRQTAPAPSASTACIDSAPPGSAWPQLTLTLMRTATSERGSTDPRPRLRMVLCPVHSIAPLVHALALPRNGSGGHIPFRAFRATRYEHMDDISVLELTDPRWSDFVARHPGATAFHHPDWARVVAGCYGFRAFALAITDAAGAIRAGLPVVEVRHFHGGPKWVSLPYTDYCPPLVSCQREEEQLAFALRRASCAAGVRRVEVRAPLAGSSASGSQALRHVLVLGRSPAEVYAGFHRSQVQRNIRRAEREGLTVRRTTCPHDLLDTFYQLHLRTRRRQGVPVQPRRFFRLLGENTMSTGLGSVLIVEVAAADRGCGVPGLERNRDL